MSKIRSVAVGFNGNVALEKGIKIILTRLQPIKSSIFIFGAGKLATKGYSPTTTIWLGVDEMTVDAATGMLQEDTRIRNIRNMSPNELVSAWEKATDTENGKFSYQVKNGEITAELAKIYSEGELALNIAFTEAFKDQSDDQIRKMLFGDFSSLPVNPNVWVNSDIGFIKGDDMRRYIVPVSAESAPTIGDLFQLQQ